ncbi:DUF1995 family protein [Oscillatoriales cyanobacterium LEGE 11467]|uniref:DUF1995 family protein n=1 Tax=Zarconia navalis LEGE 11467 TaxID=1828826 RepID=A0A928VXI8_9CYAN|nr:DUF1995 family protein [Zarconia navalis]MBE9039973.1 DUF1995 family protein [Zarconia navalis LEGE 11467]
MVELPQDLDEAIAQARVATKAAIEDGHRRLLVELVFPELKAQPITEKFLPAFEEWGTTLKVFFPDTGAAALARRDWGEVPFKIADLGSRNLPIETQLDPEDECFLIIEPSPVEVSKVEKLCQAAGDRPVVMLLPRLEDVSIVGIGYAARQLRERFLSTLESCYYIRPLQDASVFRCYPSPWQVWIDTEDGTNRVVSETTAKPMGEALEQILMRATGESTPGDDPLESSSGSPRKGKGLLSGLKGFLKALNQ